MAEHKGKPRLMDQVRARIRYLHYSKRTEKAYVYWIRRFILFHNKRHPEKMGPEEIAAFLNYLATQEGVSASTQNQALNALVFLYKRVLQKDLGDIPCLVHAKRPKRLPVVLTRDEIAAMLIHLKEPYLTMVLLMYGAGLHMMECLRLRVQDIDFDHRELFVRSGRGVRSPIDTLVEAR